MLARVANPVVAERMTPHRRMTEVGTAVALLGLVAAVVGLVDVASFAGPGAGERWAVAAVVAAALMLATCVAQVLLWRRAYAVWRGTRDDDLHTETQVSWALHLGSYAVALTALLSGMSASAASAWTTSAAVWLTVAMVLAIIAQVLSAVQYLRPEGPPGTIPAHLRRVAAWTAAQRRADD